MNIVLSGTKDGESVFLELTRKPEGSIRPGEYAHKTTRWVVNSFRKRMSSNNLQGFQLNHIRVQKGEYEGRPTTSYTLFMTVAGKQVYLNMGGGMIARGVLNTLWSLAKYSLEDNAKADLELSFYQSKKTGRNTYAIRKGGELLEWSMDQDKIKSLIKVFPNPDPSKKDEPIKNFDELDKAYDELVLKINEYLPGAGFKNAFDDLNAYEETPQGGTEQQQLADAEELFGNPEEKPAEDNF